ncbi:MAG TPA: ribosome maturation factor RimP [Gammaproteobacteria bacterium]|nr:ribosome maturation factor RimP [Gammaproteobacteria bacterium]
MQASDAIAGLIEPTVTGLGYELWGIERQRLGQRQLIRVYIDVRGDVRGDVHGDDAPAGITVEDCERVSGQIGDLLEAENAVRGDYVLEVSSPGMDRVLFQPAQWLRFVGEDVQLRLRVPVDGQRRLLGRLLSANDEEVRIATADGERTVRHSMIERARLAPAWPDPAAGKKRRKKVER